MQFNAKFEYNYKLFIISIIYDIRVMFDALIILIVVVLVVVVVVV